MQLLDKPHLEAIADARIPQADFRREMILMRARHLLDADRVLVELAFAQRLSFRQIGVIIGQPAGTISRRLSRIAKRLFDPLVAAVLAKDCPLPQLHRDIAIAQLLHRRSHRAIATDFSTNRAQINMILGYVRGWHRARTAPNSLIHD